jgi:hypothetical protein
MMAWSGVDVFMAMEIISLIRVMYIIDLHANNTSQIPSQSPIHP